MYLEKCRVQGINALPGTRLLAEHDANILTVARWYTTPMKSAIRYNMIEVVLYMLSYGARVSILDVRSVDMLKVLIRYGGDIHSRNDSGGTILHNTVMQYLDKSILALLKSNLPSNYSRGRKQ